MGYYFFFPPTGKGSGFLPNFYLLATVLPKHFVLSRKPEM